MKRTFDLVFALILSILLLIPGLILILCVRVTSKGPAIYWSKRVGKNNKEFMMPKFRSMYVEAPQIATHLMAQSAQSYVTPLGVFLRKSSLDELPQLFSIIKGDMSFVGPRPALFNQDDLIQLRKSAEVDSLLPGVTGWAQINGRDEISIKEKVVLDRFYLEHKNILLDIKIIFLTLIKVFMRSNVTH